VAALRIVQGPDVGRLLTLDHPEMIVGRNADCDVVLPSAAVARQHVRLIRQGDRWYIEDLNTRGGTWVNGAQIRGRTLLQEADRVQICAWVLAFVVRGP
jgi:sigma-B regulation protein RsbU (phosphoserine phosphatase)